MRSLVAVFIIGLCWTATDQSPLVGLTELQPSPDIGLSISDQSSDAGPSVPSTDVGLSELHESPNSGVSNQSPVFGMSELQQSLVAEQSDGASNDVTPCPPGYSQINGSNTQDCFKVYTPRDQKTFNDAESQCKQDGGHLASIHSYEERRGINRINGYPVMIGIKCTTTSSCEWSDGSPMDYGVFFEGEPKLDKGNCAHLVPNDDEFRSWDCSFPSEFLCRQPRKWAACAKEYKELNDKCYALKTTPKTSDEAEQDCIRDGGHLLSIGDKKVNDMLMDELWEFESNVHIGARFDKKTGGFQWTDGTRYEYNNWAPVFPDTRFGACAQLIKTNKEFGGYSQWTNVPCDTQLPYVCVTDRRASDASHTCPPMQYFENKGTVYSPGFPVSIPDYLHCEYLLVTDLESTISVTFPFFNISNDNKLSIYDGMFASSPDYVLHGSAHAGSVFRSTQNIMKLVFETNEMTVGEGWKAEFTTID